MNDFGRLACAAAPLQSQDNLHSVKMQPGSIGISAKGNNDGTITGLTPGGQGEGLGVKVGWKFHTVDGKPFSEQLLGELTKGNADYEVVFKSEEEEKDHVSPPSKAPEEAEAQAPAQAEAQAAEKTQAKAEAQPQAQAEAEAQPQAQAEAEAQPQAQAEGEERDELQALEAGIPSDLKAEEHARLKHERRAERREERKAAEAKPGAMSSALAYVGSFFYQLLSSPFWLTYQLLHLMTFHFV
jgi:hypothetical protein